MKKETKVYDVIVKQHLKVTISPNFEGNAKEEIKKEIRECGIEDFISSGDIWALKKGSVEIGSVRLNKVKTREQTKSNILIT